MKKSILLSVCSGLLLWIAWPPTHYTTFLLFAGLVPMLLAIEEIIRSDKKNKGSLIFRTTFVGFFIWNTLCVYWVYNALKMAGEETALAVALIPYSLAPLMMATVCWLYYRLRRATTIGWALAGFGCLWIGYEYLNQNWDLAFPWMTLGNGFATSHQWIQWYEYTGVYGGSLWVLVINILIFVIYLGLKDGLSKRIRQRLVSALVITLLFPLAFSVYRYETYSEQFDPSDVVIAQPNIDPYAKENTIPARAQVSILTHLSDSLAQRNTEFFIWPETALPDPINEDEIRNNATYMQVRHFLNKYKNGNVLTGAETYKIYNRRVTSTATYDPQSRTYYDNFNAAVNIENSAEVQFYHKSKLVPGVEALPFPKLLAFLKPIFDHLGGATGSYGGQEQPGVFYSQSGIGVAPAVCYETVWGEWIATSVKKGAQFIAIITNDGWWGNTPGKDQHLDYAKLRAIETRRWVCRSANTGISAFINQRGDIVKRTGWWVRTALKENINLNSNITFYAAHGDYIARLATIIAVLLIILLLIRQFRSSLSSGKKAGINK